MVEFYESGHSYWFGDKKLTSVSAFVGKYFPDYQENYWLTYKAIEEVLGKDEFKRIKRSYFPGQPAPYLPDLCKVFLPMVEASEFFSIREKIKLKWNKKRVVSGYRGTLFHKEQEIKSLNKEFEINPFDGKKYEVQKPVKKLDNESLCENLYDLADGFYPELLVFNIELGLAGQSDKVFIESIGNKRYVDLDDLKTNEKKPSRSSAEKGVGPLSHLTASKHNKYSLQISTYGYLLETHGFEVRNLAYTHYTNYDPNQGNLVPVEYMKKEILAIISAE